MLAYCVMENHAHFVADAVVEGALEALDRLTAAYDKWFRDAHGFGSPIRGAPRVWEARTTDDLLFKLHYVHRNPLKPRPPIVDSAVEYPWSSLRECVALSFVDLADLERARQLLGDAGVSTIGSYPALADLDRCRRSEHSLSLILAAAAQVFGLGPEEVTERQRKDRTRAAARRCAARLAWIEGWTHGEIACALQVSRVRVTQLAGSEGPASGAIRAARTLLRDPALRRWLVPLPAMRDARRGACLGGRSATQAHDARRLRFHA